MISTLTRNTSLILISGLSSLHAGAADLNARDFFGAPSGTNLSALYFPVSRSNNYHGPADSTGKADLTVNAVAYRQVFFTDICGTLCTPQFIVSLADINARLPGADQHTSESGFGDPMVGGTIFFVNDPTSRTYSGLLTLITLPVGEYHSNNPGVSPGANRWSTTFIYNYTQGVGEKWVLEANLEAQLYGKNDDYFGSDLKQDPLYRLQAFASYDFTASTYGAFRLIHADGGELRINDQRIENTHQRYTQLGFEVGHWLDSQNQLMFSLSQKITTDNGYGGNDALLRLVHVF